MHAVQITPPHADFAGRLLLQARYYAQQRGFAAARRPKQRHKLRIIDAESYIFQHRTRPARKGFLQVFNFYFSHIFSLPACRASAQDYFAAGVSGRVLKFQNNAV